MPALHLAQHDAPSDPALVAILRRCAERDPNCLHDLEAAVGEQVRAVLARALGSSDIANFALPAVLSDLRDRAGLFEPDRQPAEDWVFGQVRARLRELTQAATQFPASRPTIVRPAPPMSQARQAESGFSQTAIIKLRPVTTRTTATAYPNLAWPNDTEKSARSKSIALSKRQRCQGASRSSWPLARAAAALMAFGVTLSVLVAYGPWLVVQQDIRPGFNERGALPSTTAVPSAAAIIRPPPPPHPQSAAETVPAVASATQSEPQPLLIDPGVQNSPTMRSGSQAVLAPRPQQSYSATFSPSSTVLAVPPPIPRPMVTIAEAPNRTNSASTVLQPAPIVAAPTRVFIHHTAGSEPDTVAARSLADRLNQDGFDVAGIRAVPFTIRTGSVRYYFDHDQDAARRLAANYGASIGLPDGRSLSAQDFSYYEPKPTSGTVEVWIESR